MKSTTWTRLGHWYLWPWDLGGHRDMFLFSHAVQCRLSTYYGTIWLVHSSHIYNRNGLILRRVDFQTTRVTCRPEENQFAPFTEQKFLEVFIWIQCERQVIWQTTSCMYYFRPLLHKILRGFHLNPVWAPSYLTNHFVYVLLQTIATRFPSAVIRIWINPLGHSADSCPSIYELVPVKKIMIKNTKMISYL